MSTTGTTPPLNAPTLSHHTALTRHAGSTQQLLPRTGADIVKENGSREAPGKHVALQVLVKQDVSQREDPMHESQTDSQQGFENALKPRATSSTHVIAWHGIASERASDGAIQLSLYRFKHTVNCKPWCSASMVPLLSTCPSSSSPSPSHSSNTVSPLNP